MAPATAVTAALRRARIRGGCSRRVAGVLPPFVLLANDNRSDATATIRFLLEGGGADRASGDAARLVTRARSTRDRFRSSWIDRSASTSPRRVPIIAERAMYLPAAARACSREAPNPRASTTSSRRWFLAEGATGPFFECYILMSNPNTAVAHTTVTYLLRGAGRRSRGRLDVPANGRTTINVETVDPRLANAAVSTTIDVGRGDRRRALDALARHLARLARGAQQRRRDRSRPALGRRGRTDWRAARLHDLHPAAPNRTPRRRRSR